MKLSNIALFLLSALSVCICQNLAFPQSIFVNEFMASNVSTITDPDYHENGDWIELFNAANTAVNLKGYSITDLLTQPKKYVFTSDLIIPPQSFIIVWADDKNVSNHANFKLSASGEYIGLFDSLGGVVDTLSFGAQVNDVSYGRFPNGSAHWFKFSPASPGTTNLESQIFDKLVPPVLSHQSGFSPGPIDVTVTHPDAGVALRYTTNGGTPTSQSPLYTTAIHLDSTAVLRVRATKTGSRPSAIVTATLFINEQTNLPVFSLVTDPENFFSDTSGIYVEGTNGIIANCSTTKKNWNQDWERPVELEFFEKDRTSAFKVSAGVQIFGGCARLYPEKSLAFYFRGDYGFDKLRYRLFPDLYITEYNNFVLRSSGQDWWRTMFRDGMVQTLIEQGMKIDYQDYRPSVLFINGQYWGIHNIREKLNEHYVESHFGINGDSVDLVEISKGTVANNGDLDAYNSMINFLSANSLSASANYEYMKSIVDIDEYIDYTIAEIYAANGDWPGANMKLWRERTPSGRWRWMIYDLDFTFGGNTQGQYDTNTLEQATATNGPSWPNPPWSTLMLRKLLENAVFKNEFIQRFAVHLNTTFDKDHVVAVIDSLALGIVTEVPRHKLRWPQSLSIGTTNPVTWTGNIQIMRDFAASRPAAARAHFMAKFSIAEIRSLVIGRNEPEWGKVYTHSVEVTKNGSTNLFFSTIPLRVKAVAMPGYHFARWQGVISSANPETTITLNSNSSLTALFEPATLTISSPVINEINYKSSALFDTDDWVEFYVPSADSIDFNGWKFRNDSLHVFSFPSHYRVPGREYLVLCRDTAKFRALRPEVKRILGNMNFGLSSSGERIQLIDSGGTIVDDVLYGSSGQWNSAPNGAGPTLSLINPQSDNALPEKWQASQLYGTPGYLNDVYVTKVSEEKTSLPAAYLLFNNYPNPFNPTTTIRYELPQACFVTLDVFDLLGRKVAALVDERQSAGVYRVVFDAKDLSSGVYLCRMKAGEAAQTTKLILFK